MKKSAMIFFIVFFMCITLSQSAHADSYEIVASGDNDAVYHLNRYGRDIGTDWNSAASPNQVSYMFMSGTQSSVDYYQTYMQFSLSGIPSGADITNAKFAFNIKDISKPGDVDVAYLNGASNPSGANGNATQKIDGDTSILTIKDQGTGWVYADVTKLITGNITNGNSYAAFNVWSPNNGDWVYTGLSFYSGETPALAPRLLVTTTPEPISMALFGLGAGVLGLAGARRRKKTA